jgi:tetratricopeptide (TPR) repeat protein
MLGEYEKARQSFEEALELNPDHKGTVDAMAMYTNNPDQRALSRQILGMSSERVPDGPAQKLTIIRQRLVEGNYTDALRLSEEGHKNFPTHNGFLQLIGETHLAMGNVEDAKSAFQRSIKLNAKDKESHVSLANLYFDIGKYVYAALSFSDVIYLDPENTDSRYMQGLSYFKAQEWGRAAAAWEDLLHYKPDNEVVRVLLPQTYYILAIEYNRLGNPAMGRRSFKNALSVNSSTGQWLASSMSTLGGYYREKRMYRESLAAYQEVIELIPNNAKAYLGIGLTYWNMDEKDLARSSWKKSMSIKPENNESQGWLILSEQGS